MTAHFNRPPGWPAEPPGWVPPPGWRPDPAWPAPPEGWELWIDEHGRPLAPQSALVKHQPAQDKRVGEALIAAYKSIRTGVVSSARVRTWGIVGLGAVLTLVAVAGYQSSKGPHSQDEQIAYQSGYSNGYQGFSGTFLAEVNSEDDCNQLAIQEIGVTVSQMHRTGAKTRSTLTFGGT
jgi:hypothetical protein